MCIGFAVLTSAQPIQPFRIDAINEAWRDGAQLWCVGCGEKLSQHAFRDQHVHSIALVFPRPLDGALHGLPTPSGLARPWPVGELAKLVDRQPFDSTCDDGRESRLTGRARSAEEEQHDAKLQHPLEQGS